MASPRKNGTKGDGHDSTVTSSRRTKQRPCRPRDSAKRSLIVHGPAVRSRRRTRGRPKNGRAGPSRVVYNRARVAPVLLRGRVEGSMWGRLKTLVLAAVVGAAALVPLFGDPRSTPVTHPLWARMLLRSLDMTDAVRASTQASQVFATLAWRDSLSYPADRYLQAEGAVVREEGGQPVLTAAARAGRGDLRPRGRAARRLPAARPALGPARDARRPPRSLPIGGRGRDQVLHPRSRPPRPAGCSAGRPTSTPAPTRPSSCCPPGCTLSQVEIAPPCVNSIEPPGGWQADRRDHDRGPRGDRAQGDRRRARAAARGDADRDHRRPVPGGGARRGRRGAGEGDGPRRDDAARRARAACARSSSFDAARGGRSTPSPPSSRPAPASAGWRTAAARPSCAPARARAGGRS